MLARIQQRESVNGLKSNEHMQKRKREKDNTKTAWEVFFLLSGAQSHFDFCNESIDVGWRKTRCSAFLLLINVNFVCLTF